MSDSGGSWLDTVYGLLSESQRRYVLYYFLNNETATVDDLVQQILDWDQSVTSDSATISLLHSHLPRLADHGVLEYDDQEGSVQIDTEFTELREIVERARTVEGEHTVDNQPMEFRHDSAAESTTED